MKSTDLELRLFMLSAMRSIVDRSSPVSVVRDLATSLTTLKIRLGWDSRLVAFSFCMTAARKYCCRWMRWVSEPSPMFSRSRTKASAWAPLTRCLPAARCRFACWLLIANGRHTGTPPTSLTIDWNPEKLTSTKCWIRIPVSCSRVFHRHGAPPAENVAFSRSTWPGAACWPACPWPSFEQASIGTIESRGKLMTSARAWPGAMCSSMEVSDREPRTSAPNLWPVPARESEPMTRMFRPAVNGGRLPSMAAVTFSWWMLPRTPRYLAYATRDTETTRTIAVTAAIPPRARRLGWPRPDRGPPRPRGGPPRRDRGVARGGRPEPARDAGQPPVSSSSRLMPFSPGPKLCSPGPELRSPGPKLFSSRPGP